MKDEIAAMIKEQVEGDRMLKATQLKQSLEKVTSMLDTCLDPFLIAKLDGVDSSAIAGVIKHVKSNASKAALFISVDHEKKAIFHQCYVPKEMVEKGFSAKAWAAEVSEKVGGKMGGKDDMAQGMGDRLTEVDAAVKAAHLFATLKLK